MKVFILGVILSLIAVAIVGGYALATPSADFREADGEVSDDWGVYRTRSYGDDGFYQLSQSGFRPVIAFESLGQNADYAFQLGEQMKQEYPDTVKRAEAIFHFVRDRVTYTPDVDQFDHEEYAQNADELAQTLIRDGRGNGDCEDTTILLAVMYKGAGLRSAIALGEGHTGALVYLPEYRKTNAIFNLNGEPGWVWCEATGRNNPLGWVPKEFIGVNLPAYEIGVESVTTDPAPPPATAISGEDSGGGFSFPFPFLGVIGLLWFLSLFRRRRAG